MKKMVCMVVMACLVLGTAFAQQRKAAAAKKNALGLDAFWLAGGLVISDFDKDRRMIIVIVNPSYERLVAPHVSIGPDIDFCYISLPADISGTYFRLAVEGRYYPQSENFQGFFLGASLGFNMYSLDGSTKSKDGGFKGAVISAEMGYKVLFKSFYFEPELDYWVVGGGSPIPDVPVASTGWSMRMRMGFAF